MTSLIDVVFLLLIFFVWTASFRLVEYVLPSQVSQAVTTSASGNTQPLPTPAADFADVVVRIGWLNNKPNWQVNEEPVATFKEVDAKLSRVFSINRDAPVIVHPSRDVPLGHVIDVYDLTRRIGFNKVQFVASPENER